jgi:hypothetical protein
VQKTRRTRAEETGKPASTAPDAKERLDMKRDTMVTVDISISTEQILHLIQAAEREKFEKKKIQKMATSHSRRTTQQPFHTTPSETSGTQRKKGGTEKKKKKKKTKQKKSFFLKLVTFTFTARAHTTSAKQ